MLRSFFHALWPKSVFSSRFPIAFAIIGIASPLLFASQPFYRHSSSPFALGSKLKTTGESPKKSCCGDSESLSPVQSLVGSYYNLSNGFETTLMLNNKGPEPLPITLSFFSRSGQRFDAEPMAVQGASFLEIDLRTLLALQQPGFEEGSLHITHLGTRQQLGAQFKTLKQGILFEEQFVNPASRYPSAKLEGVWWKPSLQTATSLIISNTTNSIVTTTIVVDGTFPQQQQPASILLDPYETKVLDLIQDVVGWQSAGYVLRDGGITVEHNGTAGAVMAKLLVSDQQSGYSSVVQFSDPTRAASSKMHAGGLRVGSVDGDPLEPVVVARNLGSSVTTVSGRLLYTDANGDVRTINIPNRAILPGKVRSIQLRPILLLAGLPASVEFVGVELEYTTAPGSVLLGAISPSRSGKHSYPVPLMDPERMPSSAGGFPWKVDGDYNTIVYIKNETDTLKKITADLLYLEGTYGLGVTEVKPGQTIAIDFKKLRNEQTPDVNGNVIPLNLETGQIAWSVKGGGNRTMSGRSEQVNETLGIASTYACYNCCPNSVHDGWITPGNQTMSVGGLAGFEAVQQDINCYHQVLPSYPAGFVSWSSSNSSVASVSLLGQAEGLSAGETLIEANWYADHWFAGLNQLCEYTQVSLIRSAYVDVTPQVTISGPTVANDGSSVTFTSTVTGGTPTGYQWSIDYPTNSGNDPTLSFSSPTSSVTNATAKWFASPNSACQAPTTSVYTVRLTVSFANRGPVTKQASFSVSTPWDPGGVVEGAVFFTGGPTIGQNPSTNMWHVVDAGNLTWTNNNPIPQMRIPQSSQFHDKVFEHEMVHVNQWGQNGLLGSVYTVSGLFSALQGITDATQEGLATKLVAARDAYLDERNNVAKSRCNAAEIDAYTVSDLLLPHYVYQRCGRTIFANCS